MAELGVRLIFARSPQAKGRVERMAGTFQDRLVTELRLASASTIGEAQAVLDRFLPRFNARFAVAARQREPAWRPLDPALDLGAILAFRHTRTVARDNTVKYHWRTLQLLPSAQRPSYAGARVDVLERPGGELAVRHRGETIPSRLAPPRSGVLRERRSELARDPALERLALGLGSGVAPPDQPEVPAAANGTAANGASPQARVKPLRPPTPPQQTLWKAIRQAQLQGLSMRATARVLGISRNTVRRYVPAGGPPGRQGAASSTEQRPAREDIFAEPLSGQSR